MLDDTIAAIATPLGEGGLAVLRLSGPQAFAVADRCFEPVGRNSFKPSTSATPAPPTASGPPTGSPSGSGSAPTSGSPAATPSSAASGSGRQEFLENLINEFI